MFYQAVFRLDKTRAVSVLTEQLQKRSVIGCFRFLIHLVIRMKFYIKSYDEMKLYVTSISFMIRYKVIVKILICFVFPSWISNSFWMEVQDVSLGSICMHVRCSHDRASLLVDGRAYIARSWCNDVIQTFPNTRRIVRTLYEDFCIQEMDRNGQKFPAYFHNVGKYSWIR